MGRDYMKGEGAIVFIIAVVIFLAATWLTLNYPRATQSAMLWA
jgi:hypothetical protein